MRESESAYYQCRRCMKKFVPEEADLWDDKPWQKLLRSNFCVPCGHTFRTEKPEQLFGAMLDYHCARFSAAEPPDHIELDLITVLGKPRMQQNGEIAIALGVTIHYEKDKCPGRVIQIREGPAKEAGIRIGEW